MKDPITPWLIPYHDGELSETRQQQVEAHLEDCASCRTELENLRLISALLLESPPADDLTPPARFVDQVRLRLPPQAERPAWERLFGRGWQLAPFGLLGTWAFVQAVFFVSGLVLRGLQFDLWGAALPGFLPTASGSPWWLALLSLTDATLADVAQIFVQMLSSGGPLGWGFTLQLLFSIVIGLLYSSWLASWWAAQRHSKLKAYG